jgi:cephalosporin hydroxylase
MVNPVLKALARGIPAIDNIIRQRDQLLEQRDELLKEVGRLRGWQDHRETTHPSKEAKDLSPGAELDRLAEQYYGGDGNRKHPIYLAEYDRILAPMRFHPIRVLELGVRHGASMQVWRDYLPYATIVGVDIAEEPPLFPHESRFHFVQGSQDEPKVLDEAMRLAGGTFDVIIDDASHLGYLTVRSFAYLFTHALKSGGQYIIEDICTSFLPAYAPEGVEYAAPPLTIAVTGQKEFLSFQNGMVGVVKQIFDHMMAKTATGDYSAFPVERMISVMNLAIFEKAG